MKKSMTAAQGLDVPLFVMMLLLPFQWKGALSINIGIHEVAFGQMPFLFMFGLSLFKLDNYRKFFLLAPLFHTVFLAYYLWLGLSLFWTQDLWNGLFIYRVSLGQCVIYFSMGVYLMGVPHDRLCRTVAAAVPVGIMLFVGYGVFAVLNTPIREMGAGARRVAEGDPRQILLVMINFSGEAITRDDPTFQTSTIKNLIAAAFNALFSTFMVFAIQVRNRWFKPLFLVSVPLYPLVVSALLSRSNLAALLASGMVALTLMLLSPRVPNRQKLLASILALVAVLFLVRVVTTKGGLVEDFVNSQQKRYSETGSDVRFPHYKRAMQEILEAPYFGHGVGERVSDGLAVHNLFLGGWLELGLIGLVLTVAFYSILVYYFLRVAAEVFHGYYDPQLPASVFWAPTLLITPLVRALIQGFWGRFQIPEMVAIAFFFVFLRLFDHSKTLPSHPGEARPS